MKMFIRQDSTVSVFHLSTHCLSQVRYFMLYSTKIVIFPLNVFHRLEYIKHCLFSLLVFIHRASHSIMSHGGQFEQGSSFAPFESSGNVQESGFTDSTGTTGTSGTISDPSSSGHGNLGSADPSSEDQRLKVLGNLENAMESFRGRKISKTTAVSTILRILGDASNVSLTQTQKDSTFDSYLSEIQSIDASFGESGDSDEVQQRRESLPQGDDVSPRGTRKLPEPSDSDDGSEDETASKRQKLSESDMPWFKELPDSLIGLSDPSCEETRRLLRAYNRDITKAKFFVKIARNSPSGIPSSQWERILKGDAVDLNQVFASLHHVIPDEERTGRMGDTEITFGIAEAKKRISTEIGRASCRERVLMSV